MWLIVLEALLALVLLVGFVWWTMAGKNEPPAAGRPPPEGAPDPTGKPGSGPER